MPTRHERMKHDAELQRKKRQQKIFLGVGAVIAIGIVFALVAMSGGLNSPPAALAATSAAAVTNPTCTSVQSFPMQGQVHIAPNQSHPPYNSNPPTSGWHADTPQNPGIYGSPQVQEQLVHNLEHGFIVIQYNNLAPSDAQKLVEIVQRDRYHTILAPYPQMPADVRVALTAWTRLQYCTGVSEKDILAFVSAYRDQAPEKVP